MKKDILRCESCGHIIENRVIPLHQTNVVAMYRIWKWCKEKNRLLFSRDEVDHLLNAGTMYATFGNVVHFGGIFFKQGKGKWGINRERAEQFFANELEVPTKVLVDHKTKEIISREDYRTLKKIPELTEFLNEEFKFEPEYRQPQLI